VSGPGLELESVAVAVITTVQGPATDTASLKVTRLVDFWPAVSATGFVPKAVVNVAQLVPVFDVTTRLTFPANPLAANVPEGRLPRVSVAVPVELWVNATVELLEVRLKSCSRTVTLTAFCFVCPPKVAEPRTLTV
jgi:hypothetical protein